jgi:molybdopterin-guanine dinucleotide biosynthesis protein A
MNFSAVILAGGKSSRMGRDKAWLEVGGQTLLARQIDLARETGATEIFISGRSGNDYSAFGCRILEDEFPDAGPLAGIERAFGATKAALLLVLAVDLPEMRAGVLLRLAAGCSETCGVIPKLAGNIEPLAAFYPKAAYELALARLERGEFAVKDFAGQCVKSGLARFIDLPENEAKHFANWNSPADLAIMTETGGLTS